LLLNQGLPTTYW